MAGDRELKQTSVWDYTRLTELASLLHDADTGGGKQSNSSEAVPKPRHRNQQHKQEQERYAYEVSYRRRWLFHIITSTLVVAHLCANLRYVALKAGLYWREQEAVSRAPWLLLILGCEVGYFLGSLISAVDWLIPPGHRPCLDLADTDHAGGGRLFSDSDTAADADQRLPTVDVLVPTCNEPTSVPQDTVLAALALDYPPALLRVLVLDDGPDDALRAWCHAHHDAEAGSAGPHRQLLYLRRHKPAGVPHHFKCGNLNFGLTHSGAAYVVMMDADMILSPLFLRRTLPHALVDPAVAFVQVPQSFYNLAPGDPLNDASLVGYDRALVHRDRLGAATCVGTGALFRRAALDSIGGFQPHSVTEDTTTAYALFRAGWRSVYLPDRLQMGVAPWTLPGYVRQRQRWAAGAVQQLVATGGTMLLGPRGLSPLQKCLFFWHTGFYYLSVLNITIMANLLAALALRLRMTVGEDDGEDNRRVVAALAATLVLGRLAWTSLFLLLPRRVRLVARNRDESSFWWMSPFFVHLLWRAAVRPASAVAFVPTSAVDRAASATTPAVSAGGKPTATAAPPSELRMLRLHIAYAALVALVVATQGSRTLLSAGTATTCTDAFFTLGLSVFLVVTAAHMLVPVAHVLSPKLKPDDRQLLLAYDARGVPRFMRHVDEVMPKFHWTVTVYEAFSVFQLLFWAAVYYVYVTGWDRQFCDYHSSVEAVV